MLAAWGFTVDGRKVLLHLMAGSKEDAETVSAFFQDMRHRNLGDPLLVASDGASGIIKGIETCFPRSARQRCLAHRMRNLATKVPDDLWPAFKARAIAAYQGPQAARSPANSPRVSSPTTASWPMPWPASWTMDEFEACIAHLRLPITTGARPEPRTSWNVCSVAVLKLMFGAMTRAAERWRTIRISAFERRQMAALRQELDHDYEATVGLATTRSKHAPATKIPSSSRT